MYTALITRSNPTAFIFLVDQSGSMSDKLSNGRTKAEQVADVINRTLSNLVLRSTRSEGVRNYFDISLIGYGGDSVSNGFKGALSSTYMNSLVDIEANPLRVEDRKKKHDDGAGGITEQIIKFPVWLEPKASGGTPMCQGLTKVAEELVVWCDTHMDSYPPTVLHITDGESTDGNPEELAKQLRQIHTNNGSVLLFNLHLSSLELTSIEFPVSETALPDQYAKLLFRMSSELPEHLVRFAQSKGYNVGIESRGFMFNAAAIELVEFLDIGTRSANMR